jgi:hypothetical protein
MIEQRGRLLNLFYLRRPLRCRGRISVPASRRHALISQAVHSIALFQGNNAHIRDGPRHVNHPPETSASETQGRLLSFSFSSFCPTIPSRIFHIFRYFTETKEGIHRMLKRIFTHLPCVVQ